MFINKCDLCKKNIINSDNKITAGLGWDKKELCKRCGKPVLNFLLKNRLISKDFIAKLKIL